MQDIAREALLNELQALRPRLERRGVLHIALFGSRARRDNRPDSDVDLIIDIDERVPFSLIDLVGVSHEVEDRVGLPANLFVRRSLEPSFAAEAAREQVPVF
jgi:predicted nucleotidyltransferase